MARIRGAVCRLCRREGMKLLLKGNRCFTEKCAIEKRNYAPGQHGKGARIKTKLQGYGLQLREKQKVKRLYRMQEDQFNLTFQRASQEKGVVGETLLSKLERRLDNVAYRLGFGTSRDQARQLVRHGHVRVNDRKVDVPSYQVEVGDVLTSSEQIGGAMRNGLSPHRALLRCERPAPSRALLGRRPGLGDGRRSPRRHGAPAER